MDWIMKAASPVGRLTFPDLELCQVKRVSEKVTGGKIQR
jgi:hypothetical protein